MNTFRIVSCFLVGAAVVIASSASAMEDNKSQDFMTQCEPFAKKVLLPFFIHQMLKNQNPHLAAFGQAAVRTYAHGHLFEPQKKNVIEANKLADHSSIVKYLGANFTSRELAMLIAANTRLNKQNFDDACDLYIGGVAYVGGPVSETIKKFAPSVIETAHNSIAASVKKGEPVLELSISLI